MKKILFVDDEPAILDALQDSLRQHRRRWEMTFACGGDSAIAQLRGSEFDAVVSDIRMPIVNGVDVLKYAKERQPKAIRIALTGYSDSESTIQLTTLAQRYLRKPCSVEELDDAISRDSGLIEAFDNEQVKTLAGSAGRLAIGNDSRRSLIEVLNSSDGSAEDIANIVEQDVAMTAKILQLANSSFFRRQQSVISAKQAVSFLGVDVLKSLVLANQLFEVSQNLPKQVGFNTSLFFEHSMLTSTLARNMTDNEQLNASAFTAGLLHDVGKIIILAKKPHVIPDLVDQTSTIANCWVSESAQREILGCTHAEVGGCFLNLWGIPTPIVEAVTFHDSPASVHSKELDSVGIVHVCNYLAHWLSADAGDEYVELKLDRDYLSQLGVAERVSDWKLKARELVSEPASKAA